MNQPQQESLLNNTIRPVGIKYQVLKYLIAGLGNIGNDYAETRHNIGFMVLDALARASNIVFKDQRYGAVCTVKHRGRSFVLLKPSTYMNLSGHSIDYWLKKEKIPLENLLVIVDDISLPLASVRIRSKGGAGGHNGLSHIESILGTSEYARIRFGIGNGFHKGGQVDHVLGTWDKSELEAVEKKIPLVIDMIKSFGTIGIELTMTNFNRLGKDKTNGPDLKSDDGK